MTARDDNEAAAYGWERRAMKAPYRYPKGDHYHVRAEGPHAPEPERYRTQRAALAHCPDGSRVEACLTTLARCTDAATRDQELSANRCPYCGNPAPHLYAVECWKVTA